MGVVVRRIGVEEMRERLAAFEERYSMRSEEFYDRFRAGELGDDADFIRWAGLCYMAVRNGVLQQAAARG